MPREVVFRVVTLGFRNLRDAGIRFYLICTMQKILELEEKRLEIL